MKDVANNRATATKKQRRNLCKNYSNFGEKRKSHRQTVWVFLTVAVISFGAVIIAPLQLTKEQWALHYENDPNHIGDWVIALGLPLAVSLTFGICLTLWKMKTLTFILGWLVTRMPVCLFVENSTLMGVLKRWYKTNGIYKFRVGEKIQLKDQTICGYGIRPEGVVKGYKIESNGEGNYIIDMTSEDYLRNLKDGCVPDNVKRVTRQEVHFKWNIEHQFKIATQTKQRLERKWLKVVTAPTVLGVILGFGFASMILFVSGDKNVTDKQLWSTTLIITFAVAIPFSLVNWWREKKGYGACTMDDFGP